MTGFNKESSVEGDTAWRNYCELDANLDKFRGLTFVREKDTEELNKAILKSWYGEEVNTEYMKKASNRTLEGYKHHYYEVNTMAFDFADATDVEKGVYDFVAYFNNSGISDSRNGNWMPISTMMIDAIFRNASVSRPKVTIATMPEKFKCNRNAWLDGKEDLDCPGLIPIQLQGGILDSILGIFMPIILMLMIYPTVTGIVYEKEHRLRIIMKMQGLPMPVYYFVTYAIQYSMYFFIIMLLSIVGGAAGIGFFTRHNQVSTSVEISCK